MAKAKKQKSMEETLWESANKLRGTQYKDLKADFIMANLSFNQKDWKAAKELVDNLDGLDIQLHQHQMATMRGY